MSMLAFRSEADKLRFMQKVHIRENGCWEWKAARFSKGYGQFTLGEFNHRAHRVSQWNFNGPFDESLGVMHSCDREWCVCPDHLSPGTNFENRKDSVQKLRHNIGSRNGNASLTEDKVLEALSMKTLGVSQKEIAEYLMVTPMTISRIIRRERWTHV